MNLLRNAAALVSLAAWLAMPAAAGAEFVVPPGNSAATQYTETFPGSGGNIEVNGGIGGGGNGGGGNEKTSAQVLGQHTAHALESQGEEGRAVAQLATESTPGAGSEKTKPGKGGPAAGGGSHGGGSGGPSGTTPERSSGNAAAQAGSGSSGLGQVVSHGTLSSSGEMGVFLPLILIAALIWSLAYAWRRRQRPPTHA